MTTTEGLAKLNALIAEGKINPEDFYSITVDTSNIYAQGRYTPERALKYGASEIDSLGFVKSRFDDVKITLT